MPHLIANLTERFDRAIVAACGQEYAGTDPVLRRSDRADYQADVAMSLARKLKKAPRDLAATIVSHLDLGGIADKVEVAGPGFINVTLSAECLSREVAAAASDPRLGVPTAETPETVVIDYSSPNIAKEMHVGHLRSTIIGDALARTLEFAGHRVIRQNHLGDWGTPFGMLIENLVDLGEDDRENFAVDDLDAFYRQARTKFDGDPTFADRSRRRVVSLQAGDETTLALWKKFVGASTRYIGRIYEKLGVTLSDADIRGESFYNPDLDGVVKALQEKGLLRESDGAQCAFPAGFTNKEGAPLPLIVQKQDGGYGYAATDLAGMRYRVDTLGASRLLYVVGTPQQQHLSMVFAVAKDAGWLTPPARATHVAFGSVLGPDKKMFKTRSGETVKLAALLDEAKSRATAIVSEKNKELDSATQAEVGAEVGIGAIKYADLSSDRIKDYVFDWDRMLSFDGNTAAYVQFAHARGQSIARRAGESARASDIAVHEAAERAVALELLAFATVVDQVVETLQPHKMCTYLYGLASAFTSFLETCPVLKAETDATRMSRLALCQVSGKVLAQGLALLGIAAPNRM